jgi:hypothetical protein
MSASLTYYLFEGLLTGITAGHLVNVQALSGGGGGSTRHGGNADTNNPYSQGVKTTGSGAAHHHGGPIPTGRYRILPPAHDPHLGRSCRLDPYDRDQEKRMHGRSGFFIHGRGPHGSDGCIVPLESFQALMDDLATDKGGVLYVMEAMGGDRFV